MPAIVLAAPHALGDMTLLTIPMELAGNWRDSNLRDAGAVLDRMRIACLADVPLRSDRQPERLRIDDHAGGPPYVWLHTEDPTTAWIVVDVGTRDWCNLSYQFGHELGHVMANSWTPEAKPRNPCQWLEEALVEAFSLRGLARLAADWEQRPPFPNDNSYGDAIRAYRERLLEPYRAAAQDQGIETDFSTWFAGHEAFLDTHGGVDAARGAVTTMLRLVESDAASVQDLSALNRWPERTSIPLHDYLARWLKSCVELGAPGTLPRHLIALLSGA